jgi:hypothetical protein
MKTASEILRTWANLGRSLIVAQPSSSVSWDPAGRMIAASRQLFTEQAERLKTLLAESNERLKPLGDPLSIDFGVHRWLAGEREEAYSDWLEWIIKQIKAPGATPAARRWRKTLNRSLCNGRPTGRLGRLVLWFFDDTGDVSAIT